MPARDVEITSSFKPKIYKLVITEVPHATIIASVTEGPKGTPIHLNVFVEDGYDLVDLVVDSEKLGAKYEYDFLMPSHDTAVTVVLKEKTYAIYVVQNTGGFVSCTYSSAPEGKDIPVTVRVTPGYQLVHILCNDEVLTTANSYKFKMPAMDITLSAVFNSVAPDVTTAAPVFSYDTITTVATTTTPETTTTTTTTTPEVTTTTRQPRPETSPSITYETTGPTTTVPVTTVTPTEKVTTTEDTITPVLTWEIEIVEHTPPASTTSYATEVPVNTHIAETTRPAQADPLIIEDDDDINVPTGITFNWIPLLLAAAGVTLVGTVKFKNNRRK